MIRSKQLIKLILSMLNTFFLFTFMFSAGHEITEDLHDAIERNNIALANIFLNRGAFLSARNENQQTAIHIALLNNCSDELILSLIKKNESLPLEEKLALNEKDSYGNTPLLLAVQRFRETIVESLLEHKATLLNHRYNKQTPLEYLLNTRIPPEIFHRTIYMRILTLLSAAFSKETEKISVSLVVFSHESIFNDNDREIVNCLRRNQVPLKFKRVLPSSSLNGRTYYQILDKNELLDTYDYTL